MNKYPYYPLKKIKIYVPLAENLNVSQIARGKTNKKGFLEALEDGSFKNEEWIKKRNSFLDRTIPAFQKNPTFRRWLSLVMWAFYIPGYY